MATVVGIWMALSGVMPALAGLAALYRPRRPATACSRDPATLTPTRSAGADWAGRGESGAPGTGR
jgi:hypothetical protein